MNAVQKEAIKFSQRDSPTIFGKQNLRRVPDAHLLNGEQVAFSEVLHNLMKSLRQVTPRFVLDVDIATVERDDDLAGGASKRYAGGEPWGS